MADSIVICGIAELADGEARSFARASAEGPVEGFVVRRGLAIFAYVNRCPHKGTSLDWMPGQFLSVDGSHIVCATHGARFRIEDGYCFAGPCAGASLKAMAVEIQNGTVVLTG
jgi:nitrite reductase/ring-hydroxylating ferredoxin subunit